MFLAYKIFFMVMLVMSSMMAISSNTWLSAWIALEINLLAFIPLFETPDKTFSSESAIKYFIVQALASSILLLSLILSMSLSTTLNLYLNPYITVALNSALLMKMGAAPFHFWLPEVVEGLNWKICFLMLTWQKIAPLALISYHIKMPVYMSFIIILSALVGSVQGFNQTSLRKILAYSSINHMSWLLSSLLNSLETGILYFTIYSIMTLNIIIMFNKFSIYHINQLNNITSKPFKVFFTLNMLSLGGLPPLLGFLPKWMTTYNLIQNNLTSIGLMIIVLSLLPLYFYIRLVLSMFPMSSEEPLINTFKTLNFVFFCLNTATTMGLICCYSLVHMF